MSEVRLALADIAPGVPHVVTVDGTPIVLVRLGERVHAIGATCSHQGGPLGDGNVSGGTRLACPWHGWMYDLRTGQCVFPGRGAAVPCYPVRIDGDSVWVQSEPRVPETA